MSLLRWTLLIVAVLAPSAGAAETATKDEAAKPDAPVQLYGVFEGQIANSTAYSNPFDFRVVDLKTEFTAPSGRKFSFFGFYDGDGKGAQIGNVWKFRCMPDEVGTWHYRYSWSDGAAGGAGQFDVKDTGLSGPLKIGTDNSWYFMTARGQPFHARPYGLHHYLVWSRTHRMATELENLKCDLQQRVVDRGYNLVMWPDMGDRRQQGMSAAPPVGRVTDSWWADTQDTRKFSIAAFRANEAALAFCRDRGVYALPFSGMVDQDSQYPIDDFEVFLRYFMARLAPFGNYFGWSPTWEWKDIWKPADVDRIMIYVHDHDPWKRLLTAHDNSYSSFTGWLGFSMRQGPAQDIFTPNSRRSGQQQIPDSNGSGGIGNPFIDRPIIGSEDQWESPVADEYGQWTVPRNGIEAMRSSWGALMAGVIPLYDEWNAWTTQPAGNGQGEPYVRRMFDFWYSKTQYRKYSQLNDQVSYAVLQIASGIPGEEYVIYDQDGGPIAIDLTKDSAANHYFTAIWYDPATGAEQRGGIARGGARPILQSPFPADSVLFLKRGR